MTNDRVAVTGGPFNLRVSDRTEIPPAGCKIHRVWDVAAWAWVPADDCNCRVVTRIRQ